MIFREALGNFGTLNELLKPPVWHPPAELIFKESTNVGPILFPFIIPGVGSMVSSGSRGAVREGVLVATRYRAVFYSKAQSASWQKLFSVWHLFRGESLWLLHWGVFLRGPGTLPILFSKAVKILGVFTNKQTKKETLGIHKGRVFGMRFLAFYPPIFWVSKSEIYPLLFQNQTVKPEAFSIFIISN